jgi:hypothetical protein
VGGTAGVGCPLTMGTAHRLGTALRLGTAFGNVLGGVVSESFAHAGHGVFHGPHKTLGQVVSGQVCQVTS